MAYWTGNYKGARASGLKVYRNNNLIHEEFRPWSYREYMDSPQWAEKKKQYRRSRFHKQECLICGSTEFELHHRTYDRLGYEPLKDLAPLCKPHHQLVHEVHKSPNNKKTLGQVTRLVIERERKKFKG